MKNYIKSCINAKSFQCCAVGYLIAALLFLYEYIYYCDSVKRGVYHYTNGFVKYFFGIYIGRLSGIWVIGIILFLLMPIVSYVLKRKTLITTLLLFFIIAIHAFTSLAAVFLIHEFDAPYGTFALYDNINRFEKPDGDIVLCTQDAFSMFPDPSGGDTGNFGAIYIETADNTLREAVRYRGFLPSEYDVRWMDDKVEIIVTEVLSDDYEDIEPRQEYIEMTYEELKQN